jgi:putative FmdB family regulatory protein
MPIYEYDCPICGRVEAIQKVNDTPLKECPNCLEKGKHSKITKLVSPAAFHLKGSGWYKTDYASSSSSGSSKSSTESSKSKVGESKESSKTDAAPAKACKPGCGCH